MALEADRALRQCKRLAGGDFRLPGDPIDPGDHLGHRVRDLQPSIHFHEVERTVGLKQECNGAGTAVVDGPGRRHRCGAHPRPQPCVHRRRRAASTTF